MALSITNLGTFTHNTAGTTFPCAVTTNATAGATVAIFISADNASSGGSSNDINGVTDSLGNTWTREASAAVVNDPGAASAGVQGAWFWTKQDAGTITTSTTITVTLGSSTTAKSGSFTQVNHAAGKLATVRTAGAKSAGATATAATSGASGSINIGEVGLFGICIEAGTTQTCTGDSDTTNGSWSTLQYAEIGSTTSGNCSATQGKLQTTANSAQTYDVTLGISSDYHASWIVFQEIDASQTVTPTSGTASALAAGPTVALGGIGATPTSGTATATAAAPTITLGAITATPTPGTASALAADPTTDNTGGGQTVTPTSGTASALAAGPTVTLGAIGITPTSATATATAVAPSTTLGAITATPTPATANAMAAGPTTTLGAIAATPTAGSASASAAAPAISLGPIAATPTAGIATATAAAPTVALGPIAATPTPASATSSAASPSITYGAIDATPVPGIANALAADMTSSSGIAATPTPAMASALAAAPSIVLGAITATPTPAIAAATAAPPSLELGALEIVPIPASALARAADPTVEGGVPQVVILVATLTQPGNLVGIYTESPAMDVCYRGLPWTRRIKVTNELRVPQSLDGRTLVVTIRRRRNPPSTAYPTITPLDQNTNPGEADLSLDASVTATLPRGQHTLTVTEGTGTGMQIVIDPVWLPVRDL